MLVFNVCETNTADVVLVSPSYESNTTSLVLSFSIYESNTASVVLDSLMQNINITFAMLIYKLRKGPPRIFTWVTPLSYCRKYIVRDKDNNNYNTLVKKG